MRLLPSVLTILAVALTGCSSEGGSSETEKPAATAPDATSSLPAAAKLASLKNERVEIGCGLCVYEMPNVNSCATAVVVEGTPVLVKGIGEDAHEHGLCEGAREAVVSGSMDGDMLVLTALQIQ